MCDNVNTTQNAQFGSHDNKFVSQENNYYGPSLTDVYNFAMALFRDNFPKLCEEAAKIAEDRAKEFCQATMKKLETTNPQKYVVFKDPDMQYVLFEAQKAYARFGTNDMLDMLTELISTKVEENQDMVLKVSIDKAIEIAPLLNNKQLDYLSLLFLCTRTKRNSIKTLEQLKEYLDYLAETFKDADFNSFFYVNMLGCLQFSLHQTIQYFANTYGFSADDIETICPPIIKETSCDYSTSYIGAVLAITNIRRKTDLKLDINIWIN